MYGLTTTIRKFERFDLDTQLRIDLERPSPCTCAAYFRDVSLAKHREVMEVNYFGTLHTIHACLPDMLQRNAGLLCLIGSFNSLTGKGVVTSSLLLGPWRTGIFWLALTQSRKGKERELLAAGRSTLYNMGTFADIVCPSREH